MSNGDNRPGLRQVQPRCDKLQRSALICRTHHPSNIVLCCRGKMHYACQLPIYDHSNLYSEITLLGSRFGSGVLAAASYTSDLELPKVNTNRFGTKQQTHYISRSLTFLDPVCFQILYISRPSKCPNTLHFVLKTKICGSQKLFDYNASSSAFQLLNMNLPITRVS